MKSATGHTLTQTQFNQAPAGNLWSKNGTKHQQCPNVARGKNGMKQLKANDSHLLRKGRTQGRSQTL